MSFSQNIALNNALNLGFLLIFFSAIHFFDSVHPWRYSPRRASRAVQTKDDSDDQQSLSIRQNKDSGCRQKTGEFKAEA